MWQAETATAATLFAIHFLVGAGLVVAFLVLYSLTTPHKEHKLIRAGNAAAAVGLVGATIGFALPLNLIFAVTASALEAAIWGAVVLGMQILAHMAARIAMPKLTSDFNEGKVSAGVVQAGVGLVVGMITAAALTP